MKQSVKKVKHPLYRTESIRHSYFKKITPEKMVLVGFIAADGCIFEKKSKNKIYHYLCFNLSIKDGDVLDKINSELADGFRNKYLNKKTSSYTMSFPSEEICSDLMKFNIVPRKTQTFDLPIISHELMPYFLRGYFYGDGCVSGNGSSRVYTLVGTTKFCNRIKDFLLTNGIVVNCGVYATKNPNYSNLVMKGRNGSKFSKYIMSDDKMMLIPRKHIVSKEQISFTRWSEHEEYLLSSMSIEDFCLKTGRSKISARHRLRKIKGSRGSSSNQVI